MEYWKKFLKKDFIKSEHGHIGAVSIELWKKLGVGLLPCFCTGLLLMTVYAVFGFSPFGEKSISWCDMDQQVVPLLAEFRRVLVEGGDMFRSPGAGGINFWGVFFFFVSSPFTFLCAFVPVESLPWFVNWLLLLKMMCCAGTAGLFFRKMGFDSPIWGVLYAFCGFSLLYYQNLVWLDMAALFPLLLLSLYHLETKRKLLPFVAAFSAMLVINYYLSYMVVLFLLLCYGLFLLLYRKNPDERAKSAALLCLGAVLSALITAVVWLPSLLEVLFSARGSDTFQHLVSSSFFSQLPTTLPTIFTAALPFAALALIKRRPRENRLITPVLASCLLLLVPIIVQPVNRMWHTGSYQGFPTRYGYMINFLLLFLGALLMREYLSDHNHLAHRSTIPGLMTGSGLCAVYGILAGVSLGCFHDLFSTYTRMLWGDTGSLLALTAMLLVAVLVYLFLLLFCREKLLSCRALSVFLCIMTAMECFFQAGVYIGSVNNSQQNYLDAVSVREQIEETGFFRVKTKEKYFDVNLFSAMGLESLSHYTSLTPETTLTAQRRLGYSGYWMEVNSNGGTAFSDAVLANRYMVQQLDQSKEPTVISLPFVMPDTLITDTPAGFLEDLPAGSRMSIQQQLAEALFPGSEELFFLCGMVETENLSRSENGAWIPQNGASGTITWKVDITEPTLLYFDCASAPSNALNEPVNGSCCVLVNGETIRCDYPSQSDNGIVSLGRFTEKDGEVEIKVIVSRSIAPESFEVFGLRTNKLRELCENAEGASLEGSGSHFTAECTAQEGQTLFIPLSWDTGWTATVNGEEVPLYRTAGGYLSLSLSEGENRITLDYTPPGWTVGLILSGIGLLLTAVFLLWGKKRLLRCPVLSRFFYRLYLVCGGAAAALVYVFPVTLWCFYRLLHG